MTTYLMISPDGTVDTGSTTIANFQKVMHREGTVVSLRSPLIDGWTEPNDVLVGWVYDWGKVMEMPVNRKAWALYGRSPIHGPMLIASDTRLQLDPMFIEMIESPIEDWVPTVIREAMDAALEAAVAPDATVIP